MSTGENYMAEIDANLAEKHHSTVANQGHITTYASVAAHQSWDAAPSQHPQQVYYASIENGHQPNESCHSNQQKNTTISVVAPTETNTTISAPNTSLGAAATQDYSSYTSYPYSANSYGYGSSAYPNHYYGYQQPTNDSSHQQVVQGQNSGAPYQPLSSFQNASPASYSGTYYNPGDYQTNLGYQPTGYQSTSYDIQSTVWNGGNGGSCTSYDHSSYPASGTSAMHNTSIAPSHVHYQQQYNQWGGYYGQHTTGDVLCAPGTENLSTTNPSTMDASATRGAHPPASHQPPPPGTTSWRPDFTSSGLHPQGVKDKIAYNQNVVWQAGQRPLNNQHISQTTPSIQSPMGQSHFPRANPEEQQKAMHSQSSNLQFSLTNQVSQNVQPPVKTDSASDASQTSRIQIPTNPRIATNFTTSMSKTDKESTITGAVTLKPAYVSVAAPKLGNRDASHNATDNTKGTLPSSLRAYVERTFARCKNDSQRAVNQNIMKEMITKASMEGTLLTRNWDVEPLFPLPNASLKASENTQISASMPPFSKQKSPTRRAKSRWEPLPEEKLVDRLQSVNNFPGKTVAQNDFKGNNKVVNIPNADTKNIGWNKTKFVPAQDHALSINKTTRLTKRQRFDVSEKTENGSVSSDSDSDQGLTKYYSSAVTLANSPEERKRREHRVKRFEKGKNHQRESKPVNAKSTGIGTFYSRKLNVLSLAKSYEDSGNQAVEDIDWDSLTVKGTCNETEKRYLRLTSAPDPATVRPEEVLEKALLMVQSSEKNYLYKCDQLKSIRQDLTVQRIRNELTAKVYETHARLALEAGDLSEYNQCQSQLRTLYSEGIQGCHWEFSAYNLLCVILHSSNNRELLSSMARLTNKAKENEAVKHALAVRAAVTSGNYVLFFRLYKKAPNLNTCLMDLYVEKMRFEAIKCMCKSYRPTVPTVYIAQVLGFLIDGVEECNDWLRTHGAILTTDNNGEMQLDTKASSSTIYKPEPEDAVAHGDSNLAVNDFLTRTS